MPSLKAGKAFDICIEQLRDRDADRYNAALFAQDKYLTAVIGLLALHHELAHSRDDVSETMLGDIRLQWWREALDGIFSGTPRRHPVIELLAEVAEIRTLDRQNLELMIDGRAEADRPDSNETWQDLERWIDLTAGRLTDAILSVCEVTDDNSILAAKHVTMGFGLIGVARAVPAMARKGKLLLPRAEMAALDIVPEALLRGKQPENLPLLIADMVDMANGHLAEARKWRGKVDLAAMPVLLTARIADYHSRRLTKAEFRLDETWQMNSLRRQMRLGRARLTRRF